MKRTISNYTFNVAAKSVTLTDFGTIRLESILLITNVTRNLVIYQLAAVGVGGTVTTNVLTLAANITGQADTDKLNIIFEDFVSGGFVSVVNSSSTNLALNAVFTGIGEDVSAFSNIKVGIFSSAASALDGLQIQQSSNNIDWDASDAYSIPATTNRTFSVPVNLKFFRIVYTNGAIATTAFRLQVIFSTQNKQPSSVRPQDNRSNDNDFVETISALMGYNSTANVWNRVGVSNATTGGNENLVDRIKINASLRMIDNAQPSGSKLVGVTGTQALGLDVNLKTVGITNAVLGGNETLLDRLKVNASLRMIDTSQPVGSQLIGATGTQTSGLDVNIKNAKVNVEIAETQSDIHGQLVGVTRVTQLGVKFFQQSPQSALNITLVGTGTTASGIGTGIFSTGTGTTASVLAQTPATILYSAQYEAWAVLSGAFTAPTSAASFQRLGVLPATDGFAFGFNGLTFGVLTRFNSVDTFIPQASWNRDVLSGAATSTFRNNNVPIALAPLNMNMYRIRYGWYGAVNTYFEVYSPDGNWVVVHQIRTANLQLAVNMTNPNLPMTVELSKTASDATNLTITCGGWAAGVTAPAIGLSMSGQHNIAALNAALTLPTTGLASLSFTIAGTWVGTLAFQSSLDGIVWTAISILDNTNTLVTQTTTNNTFIAAIATQRYYRTIATAWTSGTATIVYYGSPITTTRPILLDAAGRQATDPSDRAGRLLGVISSGTNAIGNINEMRASNLAVTATGAAGTAATLTLPAVAGQFHYITSLDILLYSAAARVGAAAPTIVTSTNLPGAIAFTFSTAGAIGTTDAQDLLLVTPLRSAVLNTATTIVAPIATGGIWRITATYFTGT